MDIIKTKSANLTEREIKTLIAATMSQTLNTMEVDVDLDYALERLNYLNKRLKAFTDAPSVGSSEATGTEQPAPAAPAWPGS